MTPLRILVCIDSLAVGGAQRQTVELIRRLDRHQFTVRVVSLHGARMGLSRHFAPELEELGIGVTELDRRWHWSEVIRTVLGIRSQIGQFRPALVHSVSHHSNHLTRLARFFPGPRFHLLTAIRTEYDARQLRNERLGQRFSDLIVCNSPAMAEKLKSVARVSADRLRYIPNGLDVARFASAPDPSLRSCLAPSARRLVVMMARITEQKSPELLAQAVGLLKRSNRLPGGSVFWIVGERDSAATQGRLEEAIRTDSLGDVVRLFPATDQPAAFYHAADFTVLASLWEGTPNSVLESLAAGKPALVSSAANAAGVITPFQNGWVVPTADVPALADQLAEVLELKDDALAHMVPACQNRAAEFGMPSMVSRYADIYRALCADKIRSAAPRPAI